MAVVVGMRWDGWWRFGGLDVWMYGCMDVWISRTTAFLQKDNGVSSSPLDHGNGFTGRLLVGRKSTSASLCSRPVHIYLVYISDFALKM